MFCIQKGVFGEEGVKGEEVNDEVFDDEGEQGEDPSAGDDQADAGNETDWEWGTLAKLENNDFCFSNFSMAVVMSSSAAKKEFHISLFAVLKHIDEIFIISLILYKWNEIS